MNLGAIVIGEPDECWLWTGQKDKYGYGKARPGKSAEHMGVHRFVYSLVHGPIPEGHTIDHLCENKLCQNPTHLEAVPPGINALRSAHSPAGANMRKTHCPKCGGDYEYEPRSDHGGGWRRFCRPCRNAYSRAWQQTPERKAYAKEWHRKRAERDA